MDKDEGNRSSPTTIVDFDDNSTVSSTGFSAGLVIDVAARLQKGQESLASPTSRSSRRKHRTCLPPLEEAPGSSHMRTNIFVADNTSLPSPRVPGTPKIPIQVVEEPGLDHDGVNILNNKASGYALRGNEDKALRTYKRALRLTRMEVNRIQRQLQESEYKPKYLKTTIRIVLHDEWTEVALIIADIRTMMAIIYERIGDYERAIRCCEEARDVYDRQSKFDEKQKYEGSSSKINSARMTHMAIKMEDARDTFEVRKQLHEDSIEVHREIGRTKDPEVRNLLFEDVFDKLSAALALELASLGKNHPQVADTMAFLSKLFLERSGTTEKALGTMKRAVLMAEVSLGTIHPRTGGKYFDLARMYERVKRDETDSVNAILFYEKAIETFTEADGDHSRLVGSILNDVAVLHIQREEYDIAVEKLSDGLASYESAIEDGRGMFADTVQVWRNLAECYVLRKEWESATMAFKSALDVQHDARKLYDTAFKDGSSVPMPSLVSDESIGDTLKRLGKSYAAQKKYKESFGTLMEALTIFQTAYDKAQESAKKIPGLDLSGKQDQVASIIYCIAEVKEADKKYGEAIKLYEEALQLRIFSDKQRPEGKKSNHVHCAMCMAGIGSVRMARREYSLAFKAHNEAIQCARRQNLPEFHPIVQMLWDKSRIAARKMAEGDSVKTRSSESNDPPREQKSASQTNTWFQTASRLERKAQTQKSQGDIAGAIESTKIVLEFRRAYLSKRIEADRNVSKAKQQVARTLVGLARLVLINDATKEAERYFKEATDLYKSSGLSKGEDCMLEIQRELERLRWQKKNTRNKYK